MFIPEYSLASVAMVSQRVIPYSAVNGCEHHYANFRSCKDKSDFTATPEVLRAKALSSVAECE